MVDPWLKNFWAKALEIHPLPPGLEPVPSSIKPAPRYHVAKNVAPSSEKQESPKRELAPFMARLTSRDRMTSEDHFQDTRLFEFDLNDAKDLKYDPGDVCMVQPSNLVENVDFFFKELFPQLDPEMTLTLTSSDPENIGLPAQHLLPQGIFK